MNYNIRVIIADPNTKEGMNSDIMLDLTAEYAHDPEQYGNGYSLCIKGKAGFEQYIDLRYDRYFSEPRKVEYLEDWALSYWSGRNGAYELRNIKITEA